MKKEKVLDRDFQAATLSVLHIGKYYPPFMGGIETYLKCLVSQQGANMPVEVVVANDRLRTRREALDGARITRVASLGTIASMPLCPTLPWNLTGRSESIVHLHMPNPWAAQAYLMSGHKGQLVMSHHADTIGRRQLRKFVDPFVRRAMHRAAAIIVASDRYLASSEELRDFRGKCRVVPYGIDRCVCDPQLLTKTRELSAKYGTRLILAVGRLVPYKGFDVLLEAMKQVDATLLLIGTGPLQKQLELTIERLGIEAKAHLLGHVEDLEPYYESASMLVLPSVSRAEAFGVVQIEAMAAGIPVVNTDLDSGVPEVSLHGVTGITVPPKDSRALAEAINLLLGNEEMRLKYGRAAAVRAREEYSASRMAESTLQVYTSVVNS
jgi:rhamnosyl/mannosyltransferase